MRKIYLIAFVLFFALVGCGSDPLKSFVKKFNEISQKNGIDILITDDFGPVEQEEDSNRAWQLLYETNEYIIEAKYEDGKNLSGYYLVIDNNDPYEEREGRGYNAAITIIESLGLVKTKFNNEFKKAMELSSHSYSDDDYIVSFTNPKSDGITSVGLIVNFDKK